MTVCAGGDGAHEPGRHAAHERQAGGGGEQLPHRPAAQARRRHHPRQPAQAAEPHVLQRCRGSQVTTTTMTTDQPKTRDSYHSPPPTVAGSSFRTLSPGLVLQINLQDVVSRAGPSHRPSGRCLQGQPFTSTFRTLSPGLDLHIDLQDVVSSAGPSHRPSGRCLQGRPFTSTFKTLSPGPALHIDLQDVVSSAGPSQRGSPCSTRLG